jgi:hypothetical protein
MNATKVGLAGASTGLGVSSDLGPLGAAWGGTVGPAAPSRAEAGDGLERSRPRGGPGGLEPIGSRPPLAGVADELARLFSVVLGIEDVSEARSLEARAQLQESRAFDVLEVLTPRRLGEAEAAFDTWFGAVEARQRDGGKVVPMEHLTLLHVLKTGLFQQQPELAAYVPRMQAVLRASDRQLTGKERSLEQVLEQRLPRAALARMSDDAKKIHAAVFASEDHTFFAGIKDLIANHQPSAKDPIIAAGILATLFTEGGAELVGGAVHGYLLATLLEHTIHARIGHASKSSMERLSGLLERFGPLGRAVHKWIDATRFSHAVIHHGSYAGSYVERFTPSDPRLTKVQLAARARQKKELIDKLAHERGPEEAAWIFRSDYGRKLANALGNALWVAPATALVSLFSGAVAGSVGVSLGASFVAASVLTSLIFIPASDQLHPYLHMTRDEALSKAGPLMRAFLKSRYVSHIAQHHYLHHKDARVNHNLVAGADFAMGYEPTRVDAIVALRKLRSFY